MIVDLQRFLAAETPYWDELEALLEGLERRIEHGLDLAEAKRFHYLYQRASSDLAKLDAFPAEPRIRQRLGSTVARAYAEVHETRQKPHRFSPFTWFFKTFPRTFRRQAASFRLVCAVTVAGCLLGACVIYADPGSKHIVLPFPHLAGDPSERVAYEEARTEDRLEGQATAFSTFLMTHNTRISIFAMGLGITWGIGTIVLLFYNGVILGAVVCDYVLAGEGKFVAGWLLPHGAVEIPAILIAGQAGLVLGAALIGRGDAAPVKARQGRVKARLRRASGDVVTLIFGVALLLAWAGVVEAFLSQYHEPTIPYGLKIAFGVVELVLLAVFLARSGRRTSAADAQGPPTAGEGPHHA